MTAIAVNDKLDQLFSVMFWFRIITSVKKVVILPGIVG